MLPELIATPRLELRLLETSAAPRLLHFLESNKEDFERYDLPHPPDFYTVKFQKEVIEAEHKLLNESRGVRYYIFEPGNDAIVGSVSFAHIGSPDKCCSIGYKLDPIHRHKGYAFEAAKALIEVITEEFNIHKLEADILPTNKPSTKLIKKLGFEEDPIPILFRTCHSEESLPHTRFFLNC